MRELVTPQPDCCVVLVVSASLTILHDHLTDSFSFLPPARSVLLTTFSKKYRKPPAISVISFGIKKISSRAFSFLSPSGLFCEWSITVINKISTKFWALDCI